ncbi:hypothetical protein P691DRAFT_768974 [Macrolepiota fuliginosa MF-IS2]|uniref:Uncharacterized protein n=1 Tax=Macrolepiota fuliginosa MF-IS2 TaxID=1400762 RepID=A0A9P5WXN1_9AGAR|nr:hypothetical protein P691DRAFT_768974 [Macrolepiota fuliginosa MF-IS2]
MHNSNLNIIKATLARVSASTSISIPTSRSFIKVLDVPYFKAGTTTHPSGEELALQLNASPINHDPIEYMRFIHNSSKANTGMLWIDLLNSQCGTQATAVIGQYLFLNGGDCIIKGTKAHTSSPQCQQCWK